MAALAAGSATRNCVLGQAVLKSHPVLPELTQTCTQKSCRVLLTDRPCSFDSPVAAAHTVRVQVKGSSTHGVRSSSSSSGGRPPTLHTQPQSCRKLSAGKELQVPENPVQEERGRVCPLSPCPLVPLSPLPIFPVSTLPLFHFNPTSPFPFFSSPYLSLFSSPFAFCALPISTFPFSIFPISPFPHCPPLPFPIPVSPFPLVPSPHLPFPLPVFPYAPSPLLMPTRAQHRPHLSALSLGSPQPHTQPQAEPQMHTLPMWIPVTTPLPHRAPALPKWGPVPLLLSSQHNHVHPACPGTTGAQRCVCSWLGRPGGDEVPQGTPFWGDVPSSPSWPPNQ